MNGANDLEMKKAPDGRVNTSLDWSFEAIHILRNASKYKDLFDGVVPSLAFAKGYVQASFSRPAVDYMLTELDLTELIRREEKQGFGNDEIVLPTLNAADALALPGGYTHNCLDRGEWTQHITRMSLWYDENKCGSKHMRHSICVFGMEDLTLWLAHLPHLFANKLMPEFDFGAIDCWYEEMFHRSYLETETPLSRLNATLYQSMPQVRFQNFKNSANGSLPLSTPLLNTFDCKTELEQWLNGDVISFYFQLLVERRGWDETLPKIYAFDSLFYPELEKKGAKAVLNWIIDTDLFEHDLLFVPIDTTGQWSLVAANILKGRLHFYDSMHKDGKSHLSLLKEFLSVFALERGYVEVNPFSWSVFCPKDVPMRNNSFDCDVFVCKYAECLSSEDQMMFSQEDVPEARVIIEDRIRKENWYKLLFVVHLRYSHIITVIL